MIYELLAQTPDKHLDKTALASLTGLTDRAIRKQVEYERTRLGYPIFSTAQTKGYSILTTEDDCIQFIKETTNRIKKLEMSKDMAQRVLSTIRGHRNPQLNLF